ncbi:MAG: glycine zipper 2TM domain-containing protein [Holosporales bacterium]|jgi:outer membrane lipoprotein SlyB|nr:glycine zipper 2TM domain-containing protein [Holosporales bacterium]
MTKKLVTCLLGVVVLTGCGGSDFSGDKYDSRNAGEVSRTDDGVIVSTRKVQIKPDDSIAGTALGAVGGGLIGSAFGGGHYKYLTAAAGAIAGGVAGNAIATRPEEGLEYMVKLDNGSTVSVAQGMTPVLSIGQRVRVIYSQKGKGRVIAV